jgi:hypothetical protein
MQDASANSDEPLARVCAELNFKRSLVYESSELRSRVARTLSRSADVLDGVAAQCDRVRGAHIDPGREHRLGALAACARARASMARDRTAVLEATASDSVPPSPH